jgi:predicted lipid carrier protein YhbT
VATALEVERALRSLMKKLDDAELEPDSIPNRVVVCALPDLRIAFRTQLKDSRFNGLKKVELEEHGDARITARSDDLIALIDGRLNVAFAFITGKIRIDAPASDLMMMRRLF